MEVIFAFFLFAHDPEIKANLHAQYRARQLSETNYWSHTDIHNQSFKDRLEMFNLSYDYKWAGENLYRGECDLTNAYKLWEKSSSHKKVLDKPADYKVISKSEYENQKCYYVLHKYIWSKRQTPIKEIYKLNN